MASPALHSLAPPWGKLALHMAVKGLGGWRMVMAWMLEVSGYAAPEWQAW